jgi:hypothetical protein
MSASPIVEDILFFPEDTRGANIWNNQNEFIFRWGDDELSLLDAETLSILDVPLPGNVKVSYETEFRWISENTVLFSIVEDYYTSHVAKFDTETNELILLSDSNGGYFSELRNNIFVDNIDTLIDIMGNTIPLRLVGETYSCCTNLEEVRWHPSLDYLFAFTEGAPYIVDVQSSTIRLLPTCISRQASCIGWLPEIRQQNE